MIEPRHLLCGALAFAAAVCSHAQQGVKKFPVPSAPTARQASCTLARDDEALLLQLEKLGWNRSNKDFPDIPWSQKIAAVVSTANPQLELASIDLVGASVFVHLSPGSPARPASVVVLSLDRVTFRSATTCGLPAAARAGASTQSGYHAHVD